MKFETLSPALRFSAFLPKRLIAAPPIGFRDGGGLWNLMLGASLELGAWTLGASSALCIPHSSDSSIDLILDWV
jgi:hypothetical protein